MDIVRTEKIKGWEDKKNKKIFEAIDFAVNAHRGQFRRFLRVPAIMHSLKVAGMLAEKECSDEIIIAAILHDTIEDTRATLEEIEDKFGKKIASIVREVTELDMTHTWERRKQHKIEKLKTAPIEAVLIACADNLDNVISIRKGLEKLGNNLWNYFYGSKTNQERYFKTLVKIFSERLKDEPGLSLFKQFNKEVKRIFD